MDVYLNDSDLWDRESIKHKASPSKWGTVIPPVKDGGRVFGSLAYSLEGRRHRDLGTQQQTNGKKNLTVGRLGSCRREEGEVHPAFSAARSPLGHLFYGPCSTRQTERDYVKMYWLLLCLCFLEAIPLSSVHAHRTSHNQDNHRDVTQHPGIQHDLIISFSFSPIWLLPMFPLRKQHHDLVVLAWSGEKVVLQPSQSTHLVNTQVPLHSHLLLMPTTQGL